jgi:hypothetical protein
MVRATSTLMFALLAGCANAPPPVTPPATTAAAPAMSPPLDANGVAKALGVEKTEKAADGTIRAAFPRADVPVTIEGWRMPPFMGLTSWAAFAPAKAGVAEAMVMGDLVLFEDEVNAVMSVLFDNGVTVTALHNHFFFDNPHVYFMHIGGEGTVAQLGKGVRSAIDEARRIRKASAKVAASYGAPALPETSAIDGAKIEAARGVKGQAKDGMFKVTVGRKAFAACGCPVGKAMGVNTWAAFAGTEENAIVDGDFAVSEDELQPVLRSLRGSGVNVVAIHHHMSGETPRVLFVHYWGRGRAAELAASVKKTLDLTAHDPS